MENLKLWYQQLKESNKCRMPFKKNKKILITGLFISPQNVHSIYRTAADQLAEVLIENEFKIIKTSTVVNKYWRALDILSTILFNYWTYNIAIVPYYASANAYIIENWSTKLLKLLGKKIILVVHGGGLPSRLAKNSAKYLAVLNRADQVICPSPYLQFEINKYGLKSMVIENVLKLSDYQFHLKNKFRPNIFWMRTFEDIYHPLMTVQVFAKVKTVFPEAKMIMAGGDAGMLAQTKDAAKAMGVFESINFPGYISNEQKNLLATEYDIYICTNKIDNAPVTLVEMMTLGLPIVSVNSGGIPFMIENKLNGLLVEFDDASAMADAITEIIKNPLLGKLLVQNGLVTAKKYGAETVLNKWTTLFNKLK